MVNRSNTTNDGADALRTGQLTVEATYGVIVHKEVDPVGFQHYQFSLKGENYGK